MHPFLKAVHEKVGSPELPEGFDSWGMKTTDSLRRTQNNHFWPEPGGVTRAWYEGEHDNDSPCPWYKGDGLTVALDPGAMCSGGGLSIQHVLLVAYRADDVVASNADDDYDGEYLKIRTKGDVMVVAETRLEGLSMDPDVDLDGVEFGEVIHDCNFGRYATFRFADLRARVTVGRGANFECSRMWGGNVGSSSTAATSKFENVQFGEGLCARDSWLFGCSFAGPVDLDNCRVEYSVIPDGSTLTNCKVA